MKTASQPPLTGLVRTASRNLRFTLFLTTAFPIRLLIRNPNRLSSRPLARKRITSKRFAALLPSRWIWEYRLLLVRRVLRCISGVFCLNRQPVASFEPPPPQNRTSVGGAGARPEPMDSGPAAFFGLIGALRHRMGTSFECDYMAHVKQQSRAGAVVVSRIHA